MERAQVAHADELSELEQARSNPNPNPNPNPDPNPNPNPNQARSRLEGEVAAEVAARAEGASRLATVEAEAAALREEVESLRKVEAM